MMQTTSTQTSPIAGMSGDSPCSRPTLFYGSHPKEPITPGDLLAAVLCLGFVLFPVSFYGLFLFELAAFAR